MKACCLQTDIKKKKEEKKKDWSLILEKFPFLSTHFKTHPLLLCFLGYHKLKPLEILYLYLFNVLNGNAKLS